MQTKKVASIIFALLILIGGAFFVVSWIKNQPTKEQKAFADKFASDMQAAKNKTTNNLKQ